MADMTNYDRIRNMSVEEMADFMERLEMSDIDYARTFCSMCPDGNDCNDCRKWWLLQEVDEK